MKHIRTQVFRMKQQQFAAVAGVPQSRVSRWENGTAEPSLDEMARIRDAAKARRLRWSDRLFFEGPTVEPEADAA